MITINTSLTFKFAASDQHKSYLNSAPSRRGHHFSKSSTIEKYVTASQSRMHQKVPELWNSSKYTTATALNVHTMHVTKLNTISINYSIDGART